MADGTTSTLTNPVTGTGTTNYVPKWSSSSAQTNSQIFDNGTNVGLGTASPDAKFTVQGSSASTFMTLKNSGASSLGFFSGTAFDAGGSAGVYTNTNHPLIFGANSIKWMQILQNGGVGINNYGDNGYQLDIGGNIRSTTAANFATTSGDLLVGTTTSETNVKFNATSDANTRAGFIFSNPNTGSSAFTDFEVRNNNTVGLRIMTFSSNYTSSGGFMANSGLINADAFLSNGLNLMTRANAPIRFYTNGASNERMRISEGGDVGIGNTSPAYKLDITGTLRNTTGAAFATSSGNVLIGTTTDGGSYK
jgi:hypothetical protein